VHRRQTQRPSLRRERSCRYRFRGQTTVRHLGDKCFERAIVDFGQWEISDVCVDPFLKAAFLTIPMLRVQLVCAYEVGYGSSHLVVCSRNVTPCACFIDTFSCICVTDGGIGEIKIFRGPTTHRLATEALRGCRFDWLRSGQKHLYVTNSGGRGAPRVCRCVLSTVFY